MTRHGRPNILWISFEDTNPFYGCYGDPVARTPNVDRLAAEGCRWPNAFSTAGVCAPARSAIITGMYPISIGTHHMRTTHTEAAAPELPTPYSAVVPHYVKCFTEYLRAAGYYCTNNVKTDYQFTPPLTAWDECSRKAHWRNRPDKDQPFFAVFNLDRTHESGMWPKEGEDLSRWDLSAIPLPPYFPDTPKMRLAMARMYANIEHNDTLLGRLLEQLREDGLEENTIVFHWSDHGPLPRGKRWPYDAGVHVPLIVRWPGHLAPGSVNEQLVSTIDLGPTVLSLAGVPIPPHLQGRAFLGEQAAPPRRYVYMSRDRYDQDYDMVRAVRDKRFKYIRHYYPNTPYMIWVSYLNRHPIMQELWRLYLAGELTGPQKLLFEPRPVEELYDTTADPHEINNLAADPAYADELQRLRQALEEWRREVGDMGEIAEAEMVRRWYPGGKQPKTAAPVFVPLTVDSPAVTALTAPAAPSHESHETTTPAPAEAPAAPLHAKLAAPAAVQLYCATQGASIAYTLEPNTLEPNTQAPLEQSPHPRWLLYTAPIRLPLGQTTVRAKAIRIGYADSDEVMAVFEVS